MVLDIIDSQDEGLNECQKKGIIDETLSQDDGYT